MYTQKKVAPAGDLNAVQIYSIKIPNDWQSEVTGRGL